MTLVKRNPKESLPSLFNSLFEEFANFDKLDKNFNKFVPAVNVAESDKDYTIEVSVPGFKKEDFNIRLDNDVLTISGEHKAEEEDKNKNYTRKEFHYSSFERSFTLPETVNTDAIDAKYENGILNIILPKKEEAQVKPAKEIKVS
ncbi:MAG TPA: molecular chaperone Hsp20 [Flavobacteriales bacterium]|nr:molecular chaperone Hsp20 [Flavobacteriales bacterium]|tara:strand:+ start:70001 stop:70435 length:435 start_codon:yes stop_codon:yes gene_type:complete